MTSVEVAGHDVDEAALEATCERYGVTRLEVFGSVSRGEAEVGSDIDVLYTLRPEARLGWDIEEPVR